MNVKNKNNIVSSNFNGMKTNFHKN